MKKIIAVILAGIMCFSFVGCNGEQAEDTLHKTISIVQNNNRNRITAEDENYIYFYNANEILKMSKEDSSVETVYIFEGDNFLGIECIEYFDNALYMIGFGKEASMGMLMATVKTDGTGMKIISLGNTSQMPNFYTWEGKLYLDYFMMGNDRSYVVKPETLELIETEREYRARTKTSDGTIFTKDVEAGYGKLYRTDVNGKTALISSENKSVFAHHITDNYIFYILIDPVKMEKWEVYRSNLDGSNETLIMEIPIMNMGGTSFDNEYYYVSEVNGPLWKINKETLETVDISTIEDIDYTWQEVNNEKFFYCRGGECYYIDTVTGEKVEF